jgi:hypothetical protein
MSQTKTKNAAEDLMASLMEDLNTRAIDSDGPTILLTDAEKDIELSLQGLVLDTDDIRDDGVLLPSYNLEDSSDETAMVTTLDTSGYADSDSNYKNKISTDSTEDQNNFDFEEILRSELDSTGPLNSTEATEIVASSEASIDSEDVFSSNDDIQEESDLNIHSQPEVIVPEPAPAPTKITGPAFSSTEETVPLASLPAAEFSMLTDNDKTVPMAGYAERNNQNQDNQVRVSVGQSRGAFFPGYANWGNSDSQLAQAENLRIAQEKILEIEKENEKLRMQNEELIAASEIVKERADLLQGQVQEFKNDRDGLELSFKNELQLIRNQFHRKDNELQKAQMKIDELDSRLKFDMKKIRIRERELENRLEMIRAEKNALVKSKDEQILDLRRKVDQIQLEVESYRQKCIDLNKVLDTNQDSFKRTTRALRLAMANLELLDENKSPLKKVD